MKCLHPILVREWQDRLDPKTGTYKKVRTNSFQYVPCGSCVSCLSQKRNQWTYRLQKERSSSDYSFFLTLTYNEENIPVKINEGLPYFVFNKKHVQDYLKRVRFMVSKINKDLVCRYYCVSEYGKKTLRPHYHMQFFVKNDKNLQYLKSICKILEAEWTFGYFQRKTTDDANIHYVTKYCIKSLDELDSKCIDPPFILCSKRPYLGESAEDLISKQSIQDKVFLNGFSMPTPRIYSEKLHINKSSSTSDSYDPRLSESLYTSFIEEYRRTHSYFSLKEFTFWYQKRIERFESDAVRRQLTRNEKL